MLYARIKGRPSTSSPIIANWPFWKRKPELRVAVKLKSVSVQCRTERTFSRWNALICFVFSGCLTVERSSRAAREAAKNPCDDGGFSGGPTVMLEIVNEV